METELVESTDIRGENEFFKIYPNPGTTRLHIDTPSNIRIESIKIFSTQGSTIYTDHSGQPIIDISHYTNGLYILCINDAQNIQFVKK